MTDAERAAQAAIIRALLKASEGQVTPYRFELMQNLAELEATPIEEVPDVV